MASISADSVQIRIPVYDYSARKLIVRSLSRGASVQEGASRKQNFVEALSNISLSLGDGDRLGIVGNNGSGKTTLLRLLSGIYQPTHGLIVVSGRVTSLLDMTFGIEPDLTGRESVILRAQLLGVPRRTIVDKLDEIQDFSGLKEFFDLPTRTYSSGMFLRLAFSVSTILSPEILIMDEWLSVGDEDFRGKAELKLKQMVSETSILIVASHSRSLIEESCNKAIWLESGRVKLAGTPQAVCSAYFASPI